MKPLLITRSFHNVTYNEVKTEHLTRNLPYSLTVCHGDQSEQKPGQGQHDSGIRMPKINGTLDSQEAAKVQGLSYIVKAQSHVRIEVALKIAEPSSFLLPFDHSLERPETPKQALILLIVEVQIGVSDNFTSSGMGPYPTGLNLGPYMNRD
ncbi:hypothetical protein BHE74_00007728 [Ensete ventricosum]|nr:hypothetical protein GW17_00013993 [Ensete ventricosum]RWW83755.1 hypothetical protein BHE74_00007728 [Ensete ventricosum]